MTLYRITGMFLIALPIAFNLVFFALGRSFSYPDILRQPTDTVLKRFAAGGSRLIMLWYAFAMTALLAIPIALLLQQVFVDQPLTFAAAIMGVLSGLVQAMGLLRWSLLVPTLSAQYNAPTTSAEERSAVAAVFNGFHQYIGVVIGEHLGYLFTGVWTILISLMMLNSTLFNPLLALFGIVSALGVMVGLLEPSGWKPAGMINAMSYIGWSLWLLITGIVLVAA
ncbi:MAG: DUF4386 domain-containing protein [Anaerolineae bacterium]